MWQNLKGSQPYHFWMVGECSTITFDNLSELTSQAHLVPTGMKWRECMKKSRAPTLLRIYNQSWCLNHGFWFWGLWRIKIQPVMVSDPWYRKSWCVTGKVVHQPAVDGAIVTLSWWTCIFFIRILAPMLGLSSWRTCQSNAWEAGNQAAKHEPTKMKTTFLSFGKN